MKTIIVSLALLVFSTIKIFAQDAINPYEYYPDENIYQDQDEYYWYYDDAASTWERTRELPSTYVITPKSRKVKVTYSGTDVWKDNAVHQKKYHNVKAKPKVKKL